MGITQTLLLYVLVGAAVASAMVLAGSCPRSSRGALRFLAGVIFWPLFVPALLGDRRGGGPRLDPRGERGDARLIAARAQLLASMTASDGTIDGLLAPELERVEQLSRALAAMKLRIQEMDRLLEMSAIHAEPSTRPHPTAARRRNRQRLRLMRDQAEQRYQQALVQMEEMSSAVMLLRFAEGTEEEVVECLRELSARVEGITEGMLATAHQLE